MSLITLAELKDEATLPDNNIDLSDYSDAQLQKKIDWAISYIERESNRIFTDTTHTQTSETHTGVEIQLEHIPVKSVESLVIDGASIVETWYTLDNNTGLITLHTEPEGNYTYSVDYTVSEVDTDIINIARDICTDLIFRKIDGTFDEDETISSIKSGNSQISYNQSTKQGINNRLASIKKNTIFYGII